VMLSSLVFAQPPPAVGARARVASAESDFQGALAAVEAAQLEFARGRPSTFKALWSHRDDVTLSGGLGGAIEKGWDRVSARLDWASSQYSEGTRTHEEVVRHVGTDLAYVVQMETIRFRVPGQGRDSTIVLRATMVFRREQEGWRIVHRQADGQVTKQSTSG
jgi:ketosteroid isomerase-like protein